MVYTKARLEDALRVFRNTSLHNRHRGLPSENPEKHLRARYGFRQSTKVVPLVHMPIWQDQSREDNSDDDEYDPRQEKRRAGLSRKKKGQQKRKSEDAEQEDGRSKKSKLNNGPASLETNGAYTTLRLTSQQAKDFLAKFGPTPEAVINDNQDDSDAESTCFSRYVSSRTKRKSHVHPEVSKLADGLFDFEIGEELLGENLHGRTSLRSGKILDKTHVEKSAHDESSPTTDAPSKHKSDTALVQIVNSGFATSVSKRRSSEVILREPAANRIGMQDNPIEISEDSEDDIDKPTSSLCYSYPDDFGHVEYKDRPLSISKQRSPLTPTSIRSPSSSSIRSSFGDDSPFYGDHGISTIYTSYAHPIEFHSLIEGQCDFCANYRMGLLGHGMIAVEVCVYPDRPNQYEEMGSGHRGYGKAPTTMCVQCALKRLMILRCHRPAETATTYEHLRESTSEVTADSQKATSVQPQFSRIRGLDHGHRAMRHYNFQLFKQPDPELHGLDREAVLSNLASLPACSLCLLPAVWECCTWQKTDMFRNPCKVPKDTSLSVSHTFTPSRNPSHAALRRCTSIENTPSCSKSRTLTPEVITIPDSSSDTDDNSSNINNNDGSSPSCSITRKTPQNHSPQHVEHNPSSSPLPETRSTASPMTARSNPHFKPPIRGCGLKLCGPCKAFLSKRCNGLLDKKLVTKWLRKQIGVTVARGGMKQEIRCKVQARADVEFLFVGGLLDRNYT